MGEDCCVCHQDMVSQGRHLGFFFKKNTEKHVYVIGVWCGLSRCGGDHLSSLHQDAKGGPRSRTRAFSGWWPKPGAQTETGVRILRRGETESIAEKMPNRRSQVRKEELESKSPNCQPQNVTRMPGKKLGKVLGASDKFMWMKLPDAVGGREREILKYLLKIWSLPAKGCLHCP